MSETTCLQSEAMMSWGRWKETRPCRRCLGPEEASAVWARLVGGGGGARDRGDKVAVRCH